MTAYAPVLDGSQKAFLSCYLDNLALVERLHRLLLDVIKDEFERLKRKMSPEIIFTHYRGDLHQDHRLISSLTWNTFRDHMIFEYEIPKYDGDLGRPNCFVELDEPTCSRKIRHVMECFRTQRGKAWFSEDTFWGLLRIRGMEANAKTKFAEAFYCRKMVF